MVGTIDFLNLYKSKRSSGNLEKKNFSSHLVKKVKQELILDMKTREIVPDAYGHPDNSVIYFVEYINCEFNGYFKFKGDSGFLVFPFITFMNMFYKYFDKDDDKFDKFFLDNQEKRVKIVFSVKAINTYILHYVDVLKDDENQKNS